MDKSWVDFKAIKHSVSIKQVLDHYGLKFRAGGKELRGPCPIHHGDGTDAFHTNTEKNAFHCFSCGAKGNVLDLVAALEKCTVRDAALMIQSWFTISTPGQSQAPQAEAAKLPEPSKGETEDTGEPNKPLGFRLQGIDYNHPYLADRGVDAETAEYFGVGYFSGRDSMHGRVVIPIENERGELVAYAGRAIDNSEPKYRLPAGFKMSQVLYNLARATEETDGTVVLVEVSSTVFGSPRPNSRAWL